MCFMQLRRNIHKNVAQWAGAVEYTDFIFAEE